MFRTVLVFAFALLAFPANAGEELIFRDGALTIRLTKETCRIPAIAEALKEAESETPARMAYVKYRTMETLGCWGTSGDKILLGDESGTSGFIPQNKFTKASGV